MLCAACGLLALVPAAGAQPAPYGSPYYEQVAPPYYSGNQPGPVYYDQAVIEPPSRSLIEPDSLDCCQFNRQPAFLGTFAMDFVVFTRSDVDSLNLVTVDGANALDARQLDFDETLAYRITATLPSSCGCDLQFSYLGSHEFRAAQTFTGMNVEDFFFGVTGSQTRLQMEYESMLDSFEINVRTRQWQRVAPLAGFRIARLDESARQRDLVANRSFFGGTDNLLVGGQFGADLFLARSGPWRLESSIRAGFYYNDIDVDGRTANFSFDRHFSQTAFWGEVNLVTIFELGPHAAIRIGYQGVWLEGVALLFDQYDNFNVTTGNGSLDLGSVYYHGGFAGFELTW